VVGVVMVVVPGTFRAGSKVPEEPVPEEPLPEFRWNRRWPEELLLNVLVPEEVERSGRSGQPAFDQLVIPCATWSRLPAPVELDRCLASGRLGCCLTGCLTSAALATA